ncbi:MAG TPA: DUF5719 family protein [Mycobacteriales bacterium]|nr:DUF5719 family protein [Mycobacteriales bacterium]
MRPGFALLAVTALVGAGLAAAEVTAPSAVPTPPRTFQRAQVVGSLAVCPELLQAGSDVTTRLTVGTALPGEVAVRAASLVPGSGQGPTVLSRGGEVSDFGTPADTAVAVVATAVGERAGGLEAEQVSRGVDGRNRGLAGTRCESTVQDTWFVGGGTKPGVESEVLLVNPYDEEALVDLEVLTEGGPSTAPGLRGIVVPGRQRTVVKLSDLEPDQRALATRVITRVGRVSPALRDSRSVVDTPYGVDWVPRAGQPTSEVDLVGLPGGNGDRLLYVAVPGEDDAIVDVQLTLADSQLVPVDLREVTVQAGTIAIIDLEKVLAQRPASVRLTSQGADVLAGAYVENRARFNPIRELAWIGTTGPLVGPAVVSDSRVGADVDTHLVLTAPDGAAQVEVTLLARAGARQTTPPPVLVNVPAGRQVTLRLSDRRFVASPPSGERPFLVTPVEGSAPVYAARAILERGLRGPLLTVMALRATAADGVVVPNVTADPRVGLIDPRSLPVR